MKCPNCVRSMIVIEYEKIELDICMNCDGVWFDSGELDLLLDTIGCGSARKYIENSLEQRMTTTTEEFRKCPICNSKMKKSKIGISENIMIDVCDNGHGLWFDGGELNQLLSQIDVSKLVSISAGDKVIQFLDNVFQFRQQINK